MDTCTLLFRVVCIVINENKFRRNDLVIKTALHSFKCSQGSPYVFILNLHQLRYSSSSNRVLNIMQTGYSKLNVLYLSIRSNEVILVMPFIDSDVLSVVISFLGK